MSQHTDDCNDCGESIEFGTPDGTIQPDAEVSCAVGPEEVYRATAGPLESPSEGHLEAMADIAKRSADLAEREARWEAGHEERERRDREIETLLAEARQQGAEDERGVSRRSKP